MKKQKQKDPAEKPALNLIEDAVHLLRHAPVGVHLCYYIGSIPFVLGLLYFWSDMSRGAYAYDRIGSSSLEMAFLFVWMKCWQSASAAGLRAHLTASATAPWTAHRIFSLIVMQAAIQPTALILRPVALLITLPYAWVRAFYENAVILGDGTPAGLGQLNKDARRLATLWTKQNFSALVYLFFFGFVVWLNIVLLMILTPQLLRMFTGVETSFTQSPLHTVANTTFLAISIGFTYLCINPLTKAVYVLRCFYGESVHSGNDLKLGIRRAAAMAAAAAALAMMTCPTAAHGDEPQSAPAPAKVETQVNSGELGTTIERVLKREEFAWRLPRQEQPEAEKEGFISRFLDEVGHTMAGWFRPLGKWFVKLLNKIGDWLSGRKAPREDDGPSMTGISGMVTFVLWTACIIIVGLLVWLLVKNRAAFRRRPVLQAQAVMATPDITSEDVMANQLPEDEWLKLARELIEKGEYRLAARAFYLATLAHLGLRELIFIARHKSNRDYQRELRRRARTMAELQEAFGENVSLFEGAWYGEHAVTDENLGRFSSNIERIKAAA